MVSTDLDTLLDMGFDKAKAELAVKKSGGCKSLIAAGVYPLISPQQLAHKVISTRSSRMA